ncbi:uncharacterized protein [Hetaerina americana]|uniref:uncharacterized protein n=1 Tax=Hetaerina americana TaxID=62018 RepID=UPI003A7F324C
MGTMYRIIVADIDLIDGVVLATSVVEGAEKDSKQRKRGLEEAYGYGGGAEHHRLHLSHYHHGANADGGYRVREEGDLLGGASEGHQKRREKVKTITITKEISVPKPYPVEVKVPQPVPYPVKKPYPVFVKKPYPVLVEKKVPYPVHVPVKVPVVRPVPYPVEKKVPYPVHVPIKVHVPYKVYVKKPVPILVHVPVKVPVPHPIIIHKKVPVFVKEKVKWTERKIK